MNKIMWIAFVLALLSILACDLFVLPAALRAPPTATAIATPTVEPSPTPRPDPIGSFDPSRLMTVYHYLESGTTPEEDIAEIHRKVARVHALGKDALVIICGQGPNNYFGEDFECGFGFYFKRARPE